MNTPKYKDDSSDWMFLAESDLRAAEVMLREEIFHMACFHAQQAVEKALKAILRRREKVVPKIHSLAKLSHEVTALGVSLFEDDVLFLDQFYTPTRYPDTLPGGLPEGLPIASDATSAVAAATRVLEEVRKALKNSEASV